ncbi:hypothetical protein BDZ97DRAFT_1979666 [Flammula alnicola]|nr:hypothetical protein BDZ97DRAFT_1979666 [Flammula alnicola]
MADDVPGGANDVFRRGNEADKDVEKRSRSALFDILERLSVTRQNTARTPSRDKEAHNWKSQDPPKQGADRTMQSLAWPMLKPLVKLRMLNPIVYQSSYHETETGGWLWLVNLYQYNGSHPPMGDELRVVGKALGIAQPLWTYKVTQENLSKPGLDVPRSAAGHARSGCPISALFAHFGKWHVDWGCDAHRHRGANNGIWVLDESNLGHLLPSTTISGEERMKTSQGRGKLVYIFSTPQI